MERRNADNTATTRETERINAPSSVWASPVELCTQEDRKTVETLGA
jgi:hypothetical protein